LVLVVDLSWRFYIEEPKVAHEEVEPLGELATLIGGMNFRLT
jgi:hypothetical protein